MNVTYKFEFHYFSFDSLHKGQFTHKQRDVTMKLWEPKRSGQSPSKTLPKSCSVVADLKCSVELWSEWN